MLTLSEAVTNNSEANNPEAGAELTTQMRRELDSIHDKIFLEQRSMPGSNTEIYFNPDAVTEFIREVNRYKNDGFDVKGYGRIAERYASYQGSYRNN